MYAKYIYCFSLPFFCSFSENKSDVSKLMGCCVIVGIFVPWTHNQFILFLLFVITTKYLQILSPYLGCSMILFCTYNLKDLAVFLQLNLLQISIKNDDSYLLFCLLHIKRLITILISFVIIFSLTYFINFLSDSLTLSNFMLSSDFRN